MPGRGLTLTLSTSRGMCSKEQILPNFGSDTSTVIFTLGGMVFNRPLKDHGLLCCSSQRQDPSATLPILTTERLPEMSRQHWDRTWRLPVLLTRSFSVTMQDSQPYALPRV